jgi:hypothetical protein
MPIYIYTTDHKAETIDRIVSEVKRYEAEHGSEETRFRLATGNVGVMAATNETVSGAQFPMLMWVFAAIILLCLITFRSLRATLCIVVPLALVSLLAYALMALLEIGLKVSTLPVVALGVGIGVDLQPLQELPRRRAADPGGLSKDPQRDRQRGLLHRHHPGGRRRHLDLLATQVPGRHGDPADLHVPGEHAGRDRFVAGAGLLA